MPFLFSHPEQLSLSKAHCMAQGCVRNPGSCEREACGRMILSTGASSLVFHAEIMVTLDWLYAHWEVYLVQQLQGVLKDKNPICCILHWWSLTWATQACTVLVNHRSNEGQIAACLTVEWSKCFFTSDWRMAYLLSKTLWYQVERSLLFISLNAD